MNVFDFNQGRIKEIIDKVSANKKTLLFFVAPNNRRHLASLLKKPFLYVAGDYIEGKKIYDRLTEYSNKKYALMPEKEDVLIKRKSCNYAFLQERIKILADLVNNRLDGVVITCENLLNFFPNKKILQDRLFTLKKGDEVDFNYLINILPEIGYKRVDSVEDVATYRIVGDVLDVFPVGSDTPYRVNFFGDEVERITTFSLETRLSNKEIPSIEILPATDIIVPQEYKDGILKALLKAKKGVGKELSEVISEIMSDFELNPSSPLNTLVIPYLGDLQGSIYSYFDDGAVLILDDVRQTEDKLKLVRKAFENRVDALYDGKKLAVAHYDNILTYEDLKLWDKAILGYSRISGRISFFEPQEIFNLKTSPLPPYYNDIEGFFVTLRQWMVRGVKVRVYAKDDNMLNALVKSFNEHDFGIKVGFDNHTDLTIEIGKVKYGFEYPTEKAVVIGINDISRKTFSEKSDRRKRAAFELPNKGDYVVHEKHGIGISDGMQRLKTSSGEKDYYVVLYRGGDKLYLPAEQLNTLEKYNGGDNPTLHRLGGAEFERVKNRVKNSIKEMAIDLLDIYRSRHMKKGYVYQEDTPWQKELEDDFEFTETDDQLIAISEIKRDMESGKIMDRLLCGDVGFGKTEVAIRAIFKTVIEGKQVAFLAPTTVLAQQHYNLLLARMNKFKLKIELLSRFVPKDQIKKSLERIKSGESNIVVATHRILSKDVVFYDLGLIVLDEEQRFGVEHKEKLKEFRNKVNVLSLSATPIPRTLHMSLSGIRDISTLETPPKHRLPVETYVTEYTDELLTDALNRELARGGQAFILYNRVQGIESFYNRVCSLLPSDVEVVYAHGQMEESRLESAIKSFYDGEARVLVSTTIIENGVDLPNANTLIVIDADRLGLSQLYQLRGRVGRSNVLAYAYFTVREGKVLTQEAIKRFDALMSNTELGSGFKIAMRDLEIRGAGNILGREQHGQMEKVGYEMYLKLIKEGIDEAQGKEVKHYKEPELKIDGNFALKENYITDQKARVAVYRTVSMLESSEEGQKYYEQISGLYGQSEELKNVIRVGIMKNFGKKMGVEKVVIGESGVAVYFADSSILQDEKLFLALEKFKKDAVLAPSTPPYVVFRFKNMEQSKRIKLVKNFIETAFTGE